MKHFVLSRTVFVSCLLLVGLFPALLHAQSELKIGFVDAAKLLEQAPQAEQARQRLEQEFAPRDKTIVEEQKKLRELEDDMTQQSVTVAEEEKRKLLREINAQKREIKHLREEFQEEFNMRRNEELANLQSLVYEAIVQLAKEQNYDLILNDSAVIHASERVDITSRILERLQQIGGN